MPLLDDELCREYRQARQHDPHLAERETRIRHYLQVCDYHPWTTATRIAMRWKSRKEIFGDDRWLLPMTGSGAGALPPEYVEFLRTGYVSVLFPEKSNRNSDDSSDTTNQSAAVYLVDRSRLPKAASSAPVIFLAQIAFYLLTLHAEDIYQPHNQPHHHQEANDAANQSNVRILHVIHSKGDTSIYPTTNIPVFKSLGLSSPCRFQGVSVARSYEPGREHWCDYLAYRQQSITRRAFVKDKVDILAADSFAGTLNILQGEGFHRDCLPIALGGTFDYARHIQEWVRKQISLEDAMGGAPAVRNTELSIQATSASSYSGSEETNQKKPPAIPSAVSPTLTRDRIRGQGNQAVDRNRAPKSPTKKEAGSLLVRRREGESELEFARRRSRIYVKRSNDKLRRHEMATKNQMDDLELRNKRLRQDNRRLESLLAAARQIAAVHNQQQLQLEDGTFFGTPVYPV